ncbi:hypothetical protein HDV05_001257 [Chytridiales sp. JEL 0842]|nr:hypothetical protein HDV05_001257 [Chytridiales sp. JEL 0842]
MEQQLEVALKLVSALKAENEAYKLNFVELQQSHEQLSSRCDVLLQEKSALAYEKNSTEARLNEEKRLLEIQLESKIEELHSVKAAAVTTEDVEVIKLQVAAELEESHRRRIQEMEKETIHIKEVFYKLRREYEVFKSTATKAQETQAAVSNEMVQSHMDEISNFESQIKSMQASIDALSDTERVRQLTREKNELQIKVHSLTEEVQDARAKIEELTISNDQKERLSQRRLVDETTISKTLRVELDSAQQRLRHAQEEVRNYSKLNEELSEENAEIRKELLKTQTRLSDAMHQSSVQMNEMKVALVQQERNSELIINEAKKKLLELESKLKAAENNVNECRLKIANSQKSFMDKLRVVRDEELGKLNIARAETREEIQKLKRELASISSTSADLEAKLQAITLDRERLQEVLREVEAKLKESEARCKQVSRQNEELFNQEGALRDIISKLEAQIECFESQLTMKDDAMMKEKQAADHVLEMCKSNWGKDKEFFKKQIAALGSENERLLDVEKKLHEQQTIFISKTTQMKRKINALKQESANLQLALDAKREMEEMQALEAQRRNQYFLSIIAEETGVNVAKAASAQRTALYDFHVKNGGKMVEFAGWDMPLQYGKVGMLASHEWTRNSASLFDVGHMLQTRWTGKDRTKFLEKLVVADAEELPIGSSTLSLFTNENGGIIDDTVINKQSADAYYVVSNAGCAEKDLAHIRKHLADFKSKGGDADVTVLDLSLVALQGPKAVEVVSKITGSDLNDFKFMTGRCMNLDGIPVYISRCGYTGEDGFEISVGHDKAVDLCDLFLSNSDVKLAGLAVRDSLRLEAGLCLYGHDLDEDTTPVEGALTWTIGKRRRVEGGFLGDKKVLSQIGKGAVVPKRRIGLFVEGAPARENAEILTTDGKVIGKVTSGCPSPVLKKNIAMGFVENGFHKSGTELQVKVRNKLQKAVVTKMPFVPQNYFRG